MRAIRQSIVRVGRSVESALGDWLLNIRTRGALPLGRLRGLHGDAVDYDTVTHMAIRKVIRLVSPSAHDIVYDLGCGKGRVVCHFARYPARKIIGIEISEALCDIARANGRRLRHRRSPIEIIQSDAAHADVGGGTIYYFYNPFGQETLLDVLRNIVRTHDFAKQTVTIIYMNAVATSVFEQFPDFHIVWDYRRSNGQRVIIYRSR